MGNSEFKRIKAAKHNMLRIETEAYKEHEIRFPAPKRLRTLYSRGGRRGGLSSGAMMAMIIAGSGIGSM
jgi:hypothetical protein